MLNGHVHTSGADSADVTASLRRWVPGDEAFVRGRSSERAAAQDRNLVVALAARRMRRVLVDHSRNRLAAKRDGGIRVTLDDALDLQMVEQARMVDLDHALERLGRVDARQAQIVEMHLFADLSAPEIADYLQISPRTIESDLATARAWLRRDIISAGRDAGTG